MIVTVVIPNHNGERFLAPCLEALARTSLPVGVSLQAIVVDNGSRDGSAEVLARYPDVVVLRFEQGLGFARANNAARGRATGDFVAFLNNDTTVEPNWLMRPLSILMTDDSVAAVGAKLVYMHEYVEVRMTGPGRAFVATRVFGTPLDSKIQWGTARRERRRGIDGFWLDAETPIYLPKAIAGIDSTERLEGFLKVVDLDEGTRREAIAFQVGALETMLESVPALIRVAPRESAEPGVRLVQNAGSSVDRNGAGSDFRAGQRDELGADEEEEIVPSLCGAAMVVRRSDLDQVGWFDEIYGMYYEDTDLCLRLRALGKSLVFTPRAVVRHYHTGTTKEWSPFFVENVVRSHAIFIARHGSRKLVREKLSEIGAELVRFTEAYASRGRRAWTDGPAARGALRSFAPLVATLSKRRSWAPSSSLGMSRTPYRGVEQGS